MSNPQPWGGPPQQAERSDWSPRDYWVQPPQIIPPAPKFEKWVPAPEQLAFGELPRDPSRFQAQPQGPALHPPVQPAAPPPYSVLPQFTFAANWTLRDYSSNQDRFSVLATPLLPTPNPYLAPQQNARPDWTLRDYNPYQGWLAAFFSNPPSPWVPAPEQFGFGELPRDITALKISLTTNVLAKSPPSSVPPVQTVIANYATPPRDMTPERFVIDQIRLVNPGIPVVPPSEAFSSFDYEPIDMTPYTLAAKVTFLPQAPPPQIPPATVPYVEPPPWNLSQYQALQDTFSAKTTPTPPVFPKGLRPTFTVEALIRDIPRGLQITTVATKGQPSPYVFPVNLTYIERPDWTLRDYSAFQPLGLPFFPVSALQPLVPNVVGLPQAVAVAILNGAGFIASIQTATSPTVAAGLVITEVPAGGTRAPFFSVVVITVSLGKFVPQVGYQSVERLIYSVRVVGNKLLLSPKFDFISALAPTETLLTASVACTVYSGVDPAPQNVISGSAAISGTTVTQYVTGGVVGTIYGVTCTVTTSLGQTLTQSGFLAFDENLV